MGGGEGGAGAGGADSCGCSDSRGSCAQPKSVAQASATTTYDRRCQGADAGIAAFRKIMPGNLPHKLPIVIPCVRLESVPDRCRFCAPPIDQ